MILLIIVIVFFLFLIFSFLYHKALQEAWHDHGFSGVINMYFALIIHIFAGFFVK